MFTHVRSTHIYTKQESDVQLYHKSKEAVRTKIPAGRYCVLYEFLKFLKLLNVLRQLTLLLTATLETLKGIIKAMHVAPSVNLCMRR